MFDEEAIPPLRDRLNALAGFLPTFESPDFEFGRMIFEPGYLPYHSFSDDASRFIDVCYEKRWVIRDFDWPSWKGSAEAVHLRDDIGAIEGATPEQLQRLLTVLVRQERYVDGALESGF